MPYFYVDIDCTVIKMTKFLQIYVRYTYEIASYIMKEKTEEGGKRVKDSEITELYWQRSCEAIRQSDSKYGSYCMKIAENILHSREDSEECVSDTWLNAWNSIPPKRPDNLKLFFAKLTRNLAFSSYRINSAAKRGGGELTVVLDELSECIAAKSNVERDYEYAELGQCINAFVRLLPERECNIFVRRYFFTESVEEISERYNIKESNVYVILSRTREKLRRYLKKEWYFDEQ